MVVVLLLNFRLQAPWITDLFPHLFSLKSTMPTNHTTQISTNCSIFFKVGDCHLNNQIKIKSTYLKLIPIATPKQHFKANRHWVILYCGLAFQDSQQQSYGKSGELLGSGVTWFTHEPHWRSTLDQFPPNSLTTAQGGRK